MEEDEDELISNGVAAPDVSISEIIENIPDEDKQL